MGKAKQKLITRTAGILQEKGINFTESFENNKKILGREMPSKKIRNQMAGYLSKVKKLERLNKPKIPQKE